MRRPTRDTLVAVVLLFLLVAVAIIAAIQQAERPLAPPLASFSSQPNGAKALRLWLEDLGLVTSDKALAAFELNDAMHLVLLLEPTMPILETEWAIIDTWVEAGGTLLVAGDSYGMRAVVDHYDVDMFFDTPETLAFDGQTPLLSGSLLMDSAEIEPRAYFSTDRDDVIVHVANGDRPLTLSFEDGDGRVILSATPFPFSNQGLQQAGNGAFVLNLIEAAREDGLIWFDEWHHGVRARTASSTGVDNWLRQVPTGQAFLLFAAIIFVALLLGGRRFGRTWTLQTDQTRRTPLEYITAIANLNRRAGNREAVLDNYRYRLKRALGRRYRLDPSLPDGEFLAQLQAHDPDSDIDAIRSLLDRLYRSNMSESELVKLAGDITPYLD
ncbi:MAG: DUF4350 domain-containing protein [Anaerolineae bacterium]|nr:DUF4350 domain-containing protein [Anaerolineae bacterium]